ncbi:NfeD family protein [bacterium 210917-SL.2.15]|nr:NfeD family protein [bacterium 210917-SL.2.15]
MNLFSIIWLGLVVVLGFLEVVTVTLTSIWFAVGALAAMAVALFGGALWVQILVFAAVSLICVLALRPLAQTRLGGARKIATNADRIIGQEAVVKESIDNVAGTGAVSIGGTVWTARSDSTEMIPAGSVVRVLRIEGVKVFVAPVSVVS